MFSRVEERSIFIGHNDIKYKTKKVQLTIPRHLQAYYKNTLYKKSVFVYEHMGSYSDNSSYPRCELIVKGSKENEDVDYYALSDQPLSQGIEKVYNMLRESYALNQRIPDSIDISKFYPIGVTLLEQGN